MCNAAVGLLSPLVMGQAVDSLKTEISGSNLLLYGGLVVGVSLVQGVFLYLQRMQLVNMSRHVEFDLRNAFFAHLARLEPRFFQQHYTGDLMARATNDLQAVRMVCGPAIMYAANTLFTSLGAVFLMLRIHAMMTFLALSTLPIVAILTRIFGRRIHDLFEAVQEDFSDLSAKVQENLSGLRVVRAYTQEAAEEKAFDALSREYVTSNQRLISWNAAFSPLLQAVVGLGFVAVLYYGSILILEGEITAGEYVTANMLLLRLIWPMIAIGWVINLVERGSASMKRIQSVLTAEPAICDHPPLVELPAIRGEIRLQNLTFTYPSASEPVLRDISLTAPAGSTIAFVGRTGAGKSTILSLIPRLIEPDPGCLLIDGVDALRLPLEQQRGAIAMVPQDTFLFSATIRENIALGRPTASDDEVRQAADLAGLGPDLDGFPKGLDTMVGERGITLSGGQKQRVALARAILLQAKILLLDDCLSAVDAETEERILRNLRRVFPGRTVFIVSHRISAVQLADLILVLDHGRICERGTHAELLDQNGIYADLSRRQMLEEQLGAA